MRVQLDAGHRRGSSRPPAISESTRRGYASDLRDFAGWYGDGALERIDVRVLADYIARARPRAARGQALAGDDLAAARVVTLLAALHARAAARPRRSRSRRAQRAAPSGRAEGEEIEAILDAFAGDDPLAVPQPGAVRARLLGRAAKRRGGRARPRRRRLRAGARARPPRQGREGSRRAARRAGRLPASRATCTRHGHSSRAAPKTRCSSRRAAAVSTPRPCAACRRIPTACAMRLRRICSRAAPTCGRSRSCSDTPSLSTTQMYSHVDAKRLRKVYDRSHPRS